MATDPDRQSDGHPGRQRRRALSGLPRLHTVFQLGWALAIAVPLTARAAELADRPSSGAALALIEVTGIWALLAGLAWAARVAALTSCGRWGARTRHRIRDAGRRSANR